MDAPFARLAAEHSAAGDALGVLLDDVRAAAREAYDANRDEIDAAVARWRETRAQLASAVQGNPSQFSEPRTKRHAGIEFGLKKAADRALPAPRTAELVRELHVWEGSATESTAPLLATHQLWVAKETGTNYLGWYWHTLGGGALPSGTSLYWNVGDTIRAFV